MMCTIIYDAQQHRAGQIISPLTLQTITTAQMLSVGGKGASATAETFLIYPLTQ